MLRPDDRVGAYKIRSYLGRGVIGSYYTVEHTELFSLHTLLLLPTTYDVIPLELDDLFGVTHKNVLTVLAVLQVRGMMGILVDQFDGSVPLGDYLANHKVDNPKMMRGFKDVLHGVGALHKIGILHLDLRPDHILVDDSGEDISVKVANARLGHMLRTSDAKFQLDSSRFLAPELEVQKANFDKAADIFSLGAMLYELLARVPAFPGDRNMSLKSKINGTFIPITEHIPDCDLHIAEAIHKAIHPTPAQRHEDCQAFGNALYELSFEIEPAIRHEVSLGTPVSPKRQEEPKEDKASTPLETEKPKLKDDLKGAPTIAIVATLSSLAAILTISTVIGSHRINAIKNKAELQQPLVTDALSRSASLVDEAVALGVEPKRIRHLESAFESVPDEQKILSGMRLHLALKQSVADLPSLVQSERSARLVSNQLNEVGTTITPYCRSVDSWHRTSSTIAGTIVVHFGLGKHPQIGKVKLCRRLMLSSTQ